MTEVWDVAFQRAYLASVLDGSLGQEVNVLEPELFTEDLERAAKHILKFRNETGSWPERNFLASLNPDPEWKETAKGILLVRIPARQHAAKVGIVAAKKRAIIEASIKIAEAAEKGPQSWNSKLTQIVEKALHLGTPTRPPYDHQANIVDRHVHSANRYATFGIPTLDKIKGGGILVREVVVLYGTTKIGKSHFAIHIGASNLLAGIPVLHVSLENDEEETMRRYDRRITRMSTEEILGNPEVYVQRWKSAWDPKLLKVLWMPRNTLTTIRLKEIVKESMDTWGKTPVVIVDYGGLMKGPGDQANHTRIEEIHSDLCAIAQELNLGIITPFQTNRQALIDGSVGLGHAGGSYGAFQHVDTIIAMQDCGSTNLNKLKISVIGARNSTNGELNVYFDRGMSFMREWDNE